MMKAHKLLIGTTLASVIAGALTLAEDNTAGQQMTRTTIQLAPEGDMPSLGGAREWLNSPPLTPAGLRGKVVLIDFWTYTCINWRRTLPYVRAWAEKYKGTPRNSASRNHSTMSTVQWPGSRFTIRWPSTVIT